MQAIVRKHPFTNKAESLPRCHHSRWSLECLGYGQKARLDQPNSKMAKEMLSNSFLGPMQLTADGRSVTATPRMFA